MRGQSVNDAYAWFKEQTIDPGAYRADFIPHPHNYSWATIFVVNKYGMQGEIIYGGHHQLTQGFHDIARPHIFHYDFKDWTIYPDEPKAIEYLKTLANYLHVPNQQTRAKLTTELDASFSNDYLNGYFETTDSEFGTWFIDYNQTLGKMYEDLNITQPTTQENAIVQGQVGCAGKAEGIVQIVDPDDLAQELPANSVLVCGVTTPDYIPLMQQAVAVVTDQGGILSHAAIIARELGKPCIVGTMDATSKLKSGQKVKVDGTSGSVILL